MEFDYVVRTYILDPDNNILLVKHTADSQWVLPGGHVERKESLLDALDRELKEEFGISVDVIGVNNHTNDPKVITQPLPISIHQVNYFSETKKNDIQKLEFWYFSRYNSGDLSANIEIHSYKWFSIQDIYQMNTGVEVFQSLQDILQQNEDLLELI